MTDACVIFDVDGVLLELTTDEEEAFFLAFANHCDHQKLSRDWNRYKIRNDENIIAEILLATGHPTSEAELIKSRYLEILRNRILSGQTITKPISGAAKLLRSLQHCARLGIATANFRAAAQMRLETCGLWQPVSELAFGADGGGAKYVILGRALEKLDLPKSRIIYIGDNMNDVEAGLGHGVHFIGFSTDPARLTTLAKAGARHLSDNHEKTTEMIIDRLTPR